MTVYKKTLVASLASSWLNILLGLVSSAGSLVVRLLALLAVLCVTSLSMSSRWLIFPLSLVLLIVCLRFLTLRCRLVRLPLTVLLVLAVSTTPCLGSLLRMSAPLCFFMCAVPLTVQSLARSFASLPVLCGLVALFTSLLPWFTSATPLMLVTTSPFCRRRPLLRLVGLVWMMVGPTPWFSLALRGGIWIVMPLCFCSLPLVTPFRLLLLLPYRLLLRLLVVFCLCALRHRSEPSCANCVCQYN